MNFSALGWLLKIQFLQSGALMGIIYAEVKYIPNLTTKMSWDEANRTCINDKGRLARVKDVVTLRKARNAIASVSVGEKFWTGLRYDKQHGFTWNGNEPVQSAVINEVAKTNDGNVEFCYLLTNTQSKLMKPRSCDNTHYYLCERVYAEVEYIANLTTKMSWDEANRTCINDKGQLARVKDLVTLEKARNAIPSFSGGEMFWTGLRYDEKHGFTWNGNEPVQSAVINEVAKTNDGNVEFCYLLSNKLRVMKPRSCDNTHYYLCEREITEITFSTTTVPSAQPASGILAKNTPISSTTSRYPRTVIFPTTVTELDTLALGAETTSVVLLSKTTTKTSTTSSIYNTLPPETSIYNKLSTITVIHATEEATKKAILLSSAVTNTSTERSKLSVNPKTSLIASTYRFFLSTNLAEETVTPVVLSPPTTVLTNTLTGATSVITDVQQTTRTASNVLSTDDEVAVTVETFSSAVSEAPSSRSKDQLSTKNQLRLYQEQIKSLNVTDEISLQTAANVTSMFLNVLENEHIEKKEIKINVLLATKELETFAIEYGKAHVKINSSDVSVVNEYFALHIRKVPADSKEEVSFPEANETYYPEGQDSTSISIPPGLFKGQERVVVSMLFNTDESFNELDGKLVHSNRRTESRIISSVMDPHPSGVLSENVTISFRYGKELSQTDLAHCVFWNFSIRTAFNGSWSSKGCSVFNRTQTKIVCSCDHLTHFAVLMQVVENKLSARHKLALEIITYIGCGLSLVGEFLTLITYLIFLNLKQEQIQIRLNLVIALAIAQIVFLAGINASDQKGACIFVATLIHYFYLAGFAWMLIEGVFLYLMIIKVFNTIVRMRVFYAVAWGVPLLVVTMSLAIAATNELGISSYIHSDFCWVNFKNNFIWTFAAPVLVVCLVNIVIVSCVVHEIMKMQSVTTAEGERIRQGIKACALLFPLLGLTWVFGILSVTRAGLAFQYIFTILNSLQGFSIFVLHVLRSSDIRIAFLRKKQQWKEVTNFAGTKSMTGSQSVSQSDTGTGKIAREKLNTKRNQVLPQVPG